MKMTDEQAGQLLKTVYEYLDDQDTCPDDAAVDLVFSIVKQKLDEDAEHYRKVCETKAKAAKAKYEAKQDVHMDAYAESKVHMDAYGGDTDTDTDTVSDADTEADNTSSGVKTKKETRRVSKEEPNWFPTDEEMHDEFEAFLEVRKRLKAPNTVHAVTLLISRLNKLSADRDEQLAIIRQSTENGWKGLYPLKDDSKKARAAPEDDYLLSVINGGGG